MIIELELQQIINEIMDVGDRINLIIRSNDSYSEMRHSEILKHNINSLIDLKYIYHNDITNPKFILESTTECNFLYTYYTDIYNKIIKDEINMQLLFKFINIIKSIEDGYEDGYL